MIIDAILDRKDGMMYSSANFISYCQSEIDVMGLDYKFPSYINNGDEEKAKKDLCRYIDEQNYNPEIKTYIGSVEWCEPMSDYEKDWYIRDYVQNEQMCLWGIFIENVGGEGKLIDDLKKLKFRRDIKRYVGNYI